MKKILLIIFLIMAIFQMVVLATDIEIGSAATDRVSGGGGGYITVNKAITATGTGKITSVEIWANIEMANCEVATFYVVSGNNLSTRDYETVQIDGQDPGVVPAGSKQTAAVDLDVEEGDYIGIYLPTGKIEMDVSGGGGCWIAGGTNMPVDNVEFGFVPGYVISLYGTGVTEEEANAIFFGMAF